ncbi:MAG: nitroreductase family protein [Candidatus Microthrix parvicella]|jgi:nitroreductase|nr:nitroreductase family protein [Candidatus Microthrix sp.]NLH66916.1 nitroreductase family protein [Candidatus Microthrix parvicella]HBX10665.1 hypothetical protein [Candidatus Microthrix parvicella]
MTDDRPASDSAPDQASLGLLQGLATTRAIRRYTDEPVAEEDLATIVWHATREPSGSNRQPFRFLILRDGPLATQAKALLGKSFRALWAEKRRRDGYDAGSGATTDTPKARMATAMQHFVDHFEATLGRPQGHHGPVRRRPVEELIFDDAWEQPAPWAKDPPGTRFTGTGPSRSHASAAQRGKG